MLPHSTVRQHDPLPKRGLGTLGSLLLRTGADLLDGGFGPLLSTFRRAGGQAGCQGGKGSFKVVSARWIFRRSGLVWVMTPGEHFVACIFGVLLERVS